MSPLSLVSWNPSGSLPAVAWLLLPFLAAFLAALAPRLARPLILLVVGTTLAMALAAWQGWLPTDLLLLGPLGVHLQLDPLASPLLLLTALVSGPPRAGRAEDASLWGGRCQGPGFHEGGGGGLGREAGFG